MQESSMTARWWICFLLFLTWLVSYIDRSLLPMALPFIGQEFHMSPTLMGVAASAFFVGYAAMQIPGGLIADKFGARKTITLGVTCWSFFSFLTGRASNLTSLILVRILFGVGEGVHPPAAFKALSAWFPSSERGRASGLVMSSNALGPMIAPMLTATVIGAFGWRSAFYLISIPGFLIAFAVYWFLRDQPAGAPESRTEESLGFSALVRYKALWYLFFAYMTWDVTWWGFAAWLPSYLLKSRGLTLARTGVVATLPFAAGVAGMLIASYISDRTGKRKLVLAAVLLGNALFLLLTATAANTTMAVIFLTATGFFLPAIHGPFWSLFMDFFPSRVMGYSSGFINTGGQIAGIASPIIIGALIQWTGHYEAGFLFMALSAGVSALLVAGLREPKNTVEYLGAESHGTVTASLEL
jgi:sugar phosphate permease